jgi:hypothetical protein
LKIKEKKLFEQWLEQIALHRNYRQKILDQQTPLIQTENGQNTTENNLSNRYKTSISMERMNSLFLS